MPSTSLQFFRYCRRFLVPLQTASGRFCERAGILLKLTAADGTSTFGEICPWPGFGGETLDAAENFLRGVINGTQSLDAIPASLPCTRAAVSMALFRGETSIGKSLRAAALLPAGADALKQLLICRAQGFTTFKWKIGVGAVDDEIMLAHALLDTLFSGEKLRLDANGGLAEIESWLPILADARVEFLEQPFSPERMTRENFSPEIARKIALDESVSSAASLPENWPGFVVIKPALLGDWDAFCEWRKTTPSTVIYSSCFETAIGREAALQLALSDVGSVDCAHGFDTLAAFGDDGFRAHESGAILMPLAWENETWHAWFSARFVFSREAVEHFLCEQLFPESAAKLAREVFAENLSTNTGVDAMVIHAENAVQYLGRMLAALVSGKSVFCANPHWRETELHEAKAAIAGMAATVRRPSAIHIPTGGTGGRVHFVTHTAETLVAAARAQIDIWGGGALGSISPLPPWHISGLMPVVRTLISGGWLLLCDGSFSGALPMLPTAPATSLLSIVPTQLRRIFSLENGVAWLRQMSCVLLGGAATAPDLLAQLKREKIHMAIGYGMTETAAFVALWTEPFFDSESTAPLAFQPLSHAQIRIINEHGAGVPDGTVGRVAITAKSLAHDIGSPFVTQDEGFLQDGKLHLLGRVDRHIITGGEKVDPRRVEAVLALVPFVRGSFVTGEPDAEWGCRVVALVELAGAVVAPDNWQEVLSRYVREKLARHYVPKRWIAVGQLPFNERGKLDHAALAAYLRR